MFSAGLVKANNSLQRDWSLCELEGKFGARWRRTPAACKYFNNRIGFYKCIQQRVLRESKSSHEVIDELIAEARQREETQTKLFSRLGREYKTVKLQLRQ